jgi:hypothetical protein
MRALHSILAAAWLLVGCAVQAETPVYHNGTLWLDQVVTLDAAGAGYYSDVRLTTRADGLLSLQGAVQRPLAQVDEAEVLLLQGDDASLQASVHAAGLLSVPCVALEPPAVTRSGAEFTVLLAETVMADDQVCMSLLAVTPFDVSVPLDLSGLSAGHYRVRVNDLLLELELARDQP